MGIAKCSKLAAVAFSLGRRFVGAKSLGELFHHSSVRKLMACLLITLWLRSLPAMGTKWTLGILFGSLVSCMSWAVLPRRGDHGTGVASVAVGAGRRGSVVVIGGTVPGTLLCVMRRWTLFVDFSTRFVIGFGAFIMGGAFDIWQRSCIVVISGVVPTLCSALGATLCWSCVGICSWGTR